jgi:hypothetical protein
MSGLDRYDEEGIDDVQEGGEDVTFEEAQAARLRAERDLDRRDAREGIAGRRQRLPQALEGEPTSGLRASVGERTFGGGHSNLADPSVAIMQSWTYTKWVLGV